MSSIFNAVNRLKEYSVVLNHAGGELSLIKEIIISVEMSYYNTSPVITGRLIVDDVYDLNMLADWDGSTFIISYIDMFDTSVEKTFVITNIIETADEQFKKTFIFELQDLFSFKLDHSYLSKSFATSLSGALGEYITKLELTDTLEISDTPDTPELVVPKHISNLEFFLEELSAVGFTFYQTKTAVVVKSLEELAPSGLPVNNVDKPYLNETDNQLYKNKIMDINASFMNRGNILPKTKSLAWDNSIKAIVPNVENDNSSYALGDNGVNLQDTGVIQELTGFREITQPHLDVNQHNLIMKNSFMTQAELEIVVNGYGVNDINQVYELILKGNMGSTDTQSRGNQIVNGKYVSYGVTDKIVGDTMIQKIRLYRADMNSNG